MPSMTPSSGAHPSAMDSILTLGAVWDIEGFTASSKALADEAKRAGEAITKAGGKPMAAYGQGVVNMAQAMNSATKSLSNMGSMLKQFNAGQQYVKMAKDIAKVGEAAKWTAIGVAQSPAELRKLQGLINAQHKQLRDNLHKEMKSSGKSPMSFFPELEELESENKRVNQHFERLIRDPTNAISPGFWSKILGNMSIGSKGYLAISQGLKDAKANIHQSARGATYATAALSDNATVTSEMLAQVVAQRGGRYGDGRGIIGAIMRGGGWGVTAGVAGQVGMGLTDAGWSASGAGGVLGQAIAALHTGRGAGVSETVQLASTLRRVGWSDDKITQFLATQGKRFKYGQDAMSGISGALVNALPYLERNNINVGGAAEGLSHMTSALTQGMSGLGREGAGIASRFVQGLGTQMGDERKVREMARYGISPQAVRAAMQGNIEPMLSAIRGLKGRSTMDINALSDIFGMDRNDLSALVANSGKFTSQGITGSVGDTSEAMKSLVKSSDDATSGLSGFTNKLAEATLKLNEWLGGAFGQMGVTGILEKAAMASMMVGMGSRALFGKNAGSSGGIIGGAMAAGGWLKGKVMGPKLLTPAGAAWAATRKAGASVGPTGFSLGRAGGMGLGALGAATGIAGAGMGLYDMATNDNQNWADYLGGSMMVAGGGLTTAGALTSASILGLAPGAGMMAAGGLTSLAGWGLQSAFGTGHRPGEESSTSDARRGSGSTSEVVPLLRQLVANTTPTFQPSPGLAALTRHGSYGSPIA